MPKTWQSYSDFDLIGLLKTNEVAAFEALYERYFDKLYNHAFEKLNDRFLAQEVVQELFVSFWQNRHNIEIHVSLAAYFFRAIRNLIINQFKKRLIYERHIDKIILTQTTLIDPTNEWLDYTDLQDTYQSALQTLPEKCREVFVMSRNGATNKEISETLNISIKTVEQHISKALRTLRGLLNARLNALWVLFFWL
jgi:RNA polymerase sigma-70 factor (family 1)